MADPSHVESLADKISHIHVNASRSRPPAIVHPAVGPVGLQRTELGVLGEEPVELRLDSAGRLIARRRGGLWADGV